MEWGSQLEAQLHAVVLRLGVQPEAKLHANIWSVGGGIRGECSCRRMMLEEQLHVSTVEMSVRGEWRKEPDAVLHAVMLCLRVQPEA